MSTIIDKLKDKFGNFVLPVTNTKAVYDDDGNRLDNLLDNKFDKLGPKTDVDIQKTTDGTIAYFQGVKASWDNGSPLIQYGNLTNGQETDLLRMTYTGNSFDLVGNKNNEGYKIMTIANANIISDAYNPYKIYAQEEFCIYNNTLWKSKVANNTGNIPAEGTYWTATNVGNEIGTLNYTSKNATASENAFITLPSNFKIAYVYVSSGTNSTYSFVLINGITMRAFRFNIGANAFTTYGYVWFDANNKRLSLDQFVDEGTNVVKSTNTKIEAYYI